MIPENISYKKIIYLLLILFGTTITHTNAQSVRSSSYFISIENDTTFCNSLDYGTDTKGALNILNYESIKGAQKIIKGKNKVPNIVTFSINGVTFDKIPYNIESPGYAYIYSERKVDGIVKVYYDQKIPNQNDILRYYIRLPNHSYYQVNKEKNIEKYIKPFLLECPDFREAYQGDFSNDKNSFFDMIEFYNFLCN